VVPKFISGLSCAMSSTVFLVKSATNPPFDGHSREVAVVVPTWFDTSGMPESSSF
jgi:hypothetical protein